MNHDLIFGLTGWHLVGLLGSVLFSARWILQIYSSRAARRPVVTRGFWFMSIAGNCLILSYFIFGKIDLVGIISNLFPLGVALYNLSLCEGEP